MPPTRTSRGEPSVDPLYLSTPASASASASTSHSHRAADPQLTIGVGPRAAGDSSTEEQLNEKEKLEKKKQKRSLGWQKDNRPPRPSNAFISFKSSLKDGPLKREYSRRLAQGENIGVVAQQMWKNLSEEERGVWYAQAKKAKEEHALLYPGYKYRPQRGGAKSHQRRKVLNTGDEDDELEDSSKEQESPATAQPEPATTAETPGSIRGEETEVDIQAEAKTVEVYMGGNDNLDVLYKNGWKWALIRDIDQLDTPRDESANPVLHISTPNIDTALSHVDLISMASVMTHVDTGVSTPFETPIDTMAYHQSVNPWDIPPPNNLFLHDMPLNQEAFTFTEAMLKVPGMAEGSL